MAVLADEGAALWLYFRLLCSGQAGEEEQLKRENIKRGDEGLRSYEVRVPHVTERVSD